MSVVEYQKKGHLVTITMNRPEKRNALDIELIEGLQAAWWSYQSDDDAWAALFTGSGKAFCAGADIKRLETRNSVKSGNFYRWFDSMVQKDIYWSGRLMKPVISAINGFAIGAGFHLAIMADIRVAGENTSFLLPEMSMGVILLLWQNLTYAVSAEMICGFRFSAQRAYEVGLVNKVVPDARLLDEAYNVADKLLSLPPMALQQSLRISKQMNNESMSISRSILTKYAALLSDVLASEAC